MKHISYGKGSFCISSQYKKVDECSNCLSGNQVVAHVNAVGTCAGRKAGSFAQALPSSTPLEKKGARCLSAPAFPGERREKEEFHLFFFR